MDNHNQSSKYDKFSASFKLDDKETFDALVTILTENHFDFFISKDESKTFSYFLSVKSSGLARYIMLSLCRQLFEFGSPFKAVFTTSVGIKAGLAWPCKFNQSRIGR